MIVQAIFKRLLNFQGAIFALSLTALACLPIALSELVRDAGLSLLLPITIVGALLTWALMNWNIRKLSSGLILLFLGPLALFIRIGQIRGSLFELLKQLFFLFPALFNKVVYKTPFDPSFLLSSIEELTQKSLGFSGRLLAWLVSISHGINIEDPVARTFMWSMALWLIAVWAGWQIYRNRRLMAGMFPSTILLVLVLDHTGEEKSLLWFHLALFLFLFGLTHYHNLQTQWNVSHTDYSESTSLDTLMSVSVISLALVFASYLSFTISIKDIIENFRERRASSNAPQSATHVYQPAKINDHYVVTGFKGGMPRSFLLTAGPEISTQLAMTISTGDLPPMPPNANPTVPRYYWRAMTYTTYTGRGWANPFVSAEEISADQPLFKELGPSYRVIHEEVTFADDSNENLFWTGTLVRADVPFIAAWINKSKNDSTLDDDMLAAVANVQSYKAESILQNIGAQNLRDSPSVYPDSIRKRYLALPNSVPERVLALARDLTAAEPTAYDRALAIQNYLREIPYSLEVSALPINTDAVDYFLFDLKKGYCDYYATSMVVLARAAGLPARVVAGYASGAYDVQRAQYIVTENYAHSWVEVYFADIGWVEFEPTAGQPPIIYEEKNMSISHAPKNLPLKFSFKEQFIPFVQGMVQNAWFPVIFVFFCGLLWVGFDSLRLRRIDPSLTIQLLYWRLRRLARPITGTVLRNQTAHSYAFLLTERLSAFEVSSWLQNRLVPSYKEIYQLTELFSHSLFAPLPPTRAQVNDAIKTWSRLRWRLLLANLIQIKSR